MPSYTVPLSVIRMLQHELLLPMSFSWIIRNLLLNTRMLRLQLQISHFAQAKRPCIGRLGFISCQRLAGSEILEGINYSVTVFSTTCKFTVRITSSLFTHLRTPHPDIISCAVVTETVKGRHCTECASGYTGMIHPVRSFQNWYRILITEVTDGTWRMVRTW
jgi:hypothetical protein